MPNRIPTPGISTPAVRKSATAQPPAKPKQLTGEAAMNANIKSLTPAGVKADAARQNKSAADAYAKQKKAGQLGMGTR